MPKRFIKSEMTPVRLFRGDFQRFMPKGEARENATEDIRSLNVFLHEASERAHIELYPLLTASIVWDIPVCGDGMFTWIKHPGKTPSGKNPKYSELLHYACGNSFGEIHYENGRPGKARLIQWQGQDCFVMHMKILNEKLSLWKIEKNGQPRWKKA